MFRNKNVLIGITGGIAAYKILELIRLYKKNNANVKVIMTENATNFVTPLTVRTLSNNPVYIKQFEEENLFPEHVSLGTWADIFVIAPASANTIGKIANGICDNLLTSIACAFPKPIIVAPAMNCEMWNNTFVQENIKKLENAGYQILAPEAGFLACGTSGVGRLCAIEKICAATYEATKTKESLLKGKKVVITAGGTRENIDPVRYIGNYSSGKMGVALADEAYALGADVVLVNTFNYKADYKTINVSSALEMQEVVDVEKNTADCIIMAAAVADFRVKEANEQKIKKEDGVDSLTVELVKNPDILSGICKEKKENQVVIGFCAESENLIDNAKVKIQKKQCDFLVANDISRKDIGFSSDENEVYILDRDLKVKKIDKASKPVIAQKILEFVYGKN